MLLYYKYISTENLSKISKIEKSIIKIVGCPLKPLMIIYDTKCTRVQYYLKHIVYYILFV